VLLFDKQGTRALRTYSGYCFGREIRNLYYN